MNNQLTFDSAEILELEAEVLKLMDRLDKGCAVIGELEQKGQTDTKKYQVNFEHWKTLLEEYQIKQTRLDGLQKLEKAWRLFNDKNFTQPKAS